MGDTATTDVAIAINDDKHSLVMVTMMGTPKAIAVMVGTTILLTMAPANVVTISWTMTINDDSNDADTGDVGEDSLPPPMTVTTAEMTMGMMGGGGMRRGNARISWTRGMSGV